MKIGYTGKEILELKEGILLYNGLVVYQKRGRHVLPLLSRVDIPNDFNGLALETTTTRLFKERNNDPEFIPEDEKDLILLKDYFDNKKEKQQFVKCLESFIEDLMLD